MHYTYTHNCVVYLNVYVAHVIWKKCLQNFQCALFGGWITVFYEQTIYIFVEFRNEDTLKTQHELCFIFSGKMFIITICCYFCVFEVFFENVYGKHWLRFIDHFNMGYVTVYWGSRPIKFSIRSAINKRYRATNDPTKFQLHSHTNSYVH